MPLLSTCAHCTLRLSASIMPILRDSEALAASVMPWLLLRLMECPDCASALPISIWASLIGPPVAVDCSIILLLLITGDSSRRGASNCSLTAFCPTMLARLAMAVKM